MYAFLGWLTLFLPPVVTLDWISCFPVSIKREDGESKSKKNESQYQLYKIFFILYLLLYIIFEVNNLFEKSGLGTSIFLFKDDDIIYGDDLILLKMLKLWYDVDFQISQESFRFSSSKKQTEVGKYCLCYRTILHWDFLNSDFMVCTHYYAFQVQR